MSLPLSCSSKYKAVPFRKDGKWFYTCAGCNNPVEIGSGIYRTDGVIIGHQCDDDEHTNNYLYCPEEEAIKLLEQLKTETGQVPVQVCSPLTNCGKDYPLRLVLRGCVLPGSLEEIPADSGLLAREVYLREDGEWCVKCQACDGVMVLSEYIMHTDAGPNVVHKCDDDKLVMHSTWLYYTGLKRHRVKNNFVDQKEKPVPSSSSCAQDTTKKDAVLVPIVIEGVRIPTSPPEVHSRFEKFRVPFRDPKGGNGWYLYCYRCEEKFPLSGCSFWNDDGPNVGHLCEDSVTKHYTWMYHPGLPKDAEDGKSTTSFHDYVEEQSPAPPGVSEEQVEAIVQKVKKAMLEGIKLYVGEVTLTRQKILDLLEEKLRDWEYMRSVLTPGTIGEEELDDHSVGPDQLQKGSVCTDHISDKQILLGHLHPSLMEHILEEVRKNFLKEEQVPDKEVEDFPWDIPSVKDGHIADDRYRVPYLKNGEWLVPCRTCGQDIKMKDSFADNIRGPNFSHKCSTDCAGHYTWIWTGGCSKEEFLRKEREQDSITQDLRKYLPSEREKSGNRPYAIPVWDPEKKSPETTADTETLKALAIALDCPSLRNKLLEKLRVELVGEISSAMIQGNAIGSGHIKPGVLEKKHLSQELLNQCDNWRQDLLGAVRSEINAAIRSAIEEYDNREFSNEFFELIEGIVESTVTGSSEPVTTYLRELVQEELSEEGTVKHIQRVAGNTQEKEVSFSGLVFKAILIIIALSLLIKEGYPYLQVLLKHFNLQ